MKIVHLCTSDQGGAAQAAKRLHHQLNNSGEESFFFTKYRSNGLTSGQTALMRFKSWQHYIDYGLEHFVFKNFFPPNQGYSEDTVLFSSPHSLYHPERHPLIRNSDVIHLHWTSHFIDYLHFFKTIQKPIVWTLHDMNPFTGGCHYSGACVGYESSCSGCPQVLKTNKPDLAKEYLEYKSKSLIENKNLHIVTPSAWLYELSIQSRLFKHRPHFLISNGIDTTLFRPLDRLEVKRKYNIPLDKVNILFAVHSLKMKMKGFDLLLEALRNLPKDKFHLTILGKNFEPLILSEYHHKAFGHVSNETAMAELYNAADVFVTPSLRDNLPNTIAESLLCGTPVIGFKIGGIQEMILDGDNGLIAPEPSAPGLADALRKFLSYPDIFDRQQIRDAALIKYDIQTCASKYLQLYRNLIEKK